MPAAGLNEAIDSLRAAEEFYRQPSNPRHRALEPPTSSSSVDVVETVVRPLVPIPME